MAYALTEFNAWLRRQEKYPPRAESLIKAFVDQQTGFETGIQYIRKQFLSEFANILKRLEE